MHPAIPFSLVPLHFVRSKGALSHYSVELRYCPNPHCSPRLVFSSSHYISPFTLSSLLRRFREPIHSRTLSHSRTHSNGALSPHHSLEFLLHATRIIVPLHHRHATASLHPRSSTALTAMIASWIRKFFVVWQSMSEVECEDGMRACVCVGDGDRECN